MNKKKIKGFEYKNSGKESPFETFLRYTDEKEKSAEQLAKVLQTKKNDSGMHILDIGTGNGEYLALTLSKIKDLGNIQLTLLEPSEDLERQLKDRFKTLVPESRITIINNGLEDFVTNESFDIILASHLFYHIPKSTWSLQLEKMFSLLKPQGKLIVVLREKDDAYEFKMAFKPLLFSKEFQALTIDDVLACLPRVYKDRIEMYTSASTLTIPIDNYDDTVSIIEFYLNKQWHEIPEPLQNDAEEFIRNNKNIFQQLDGIAVIEKA